MRKSLATVVVSLALCSTALADRVEFNNGDVLTGKIENYDGKTLTMKTDAAGEVKIDLKNVKTFSTDEPIDLRLTDGTQFHLRAIATSQPATHPTTQGSVGVTGGVVGAQSFTLDKIKAINPPPVKWAGDITLGGDFNRGNTFTDAYHAGFDLLRRGEDDRITASGLYQYGRQKDQNTGVKTATLDNWIVNGKYDYFFHDSKWYSFVDALAQKDRIQDLNLRFVPGIGIGYQWFETPKLNFNTEVGLSWIYEDYSTQGTTEDIAARLAYHFDKQITDRLKIINELEYFPSLEQGRKYLLNADLALHYDLTKTIFAEGKIVEQFNSQPAPGKHTSDQQYIISIGWKF